MAGTFLEKTIVALLVLGLSGLTARGFAHPVRPAQKRTLNEPLASQVMALRGGQQEGESDLVSRTSNAAALAAPFAAFARFYATSLEARPILTKSVTAGCVFGISDYLAQRVEGSSKKEGKPPMNWTRTLSSMAVGLLYFGPAAHAWYEMIFKLFPGTGLVSTLQKAALGQLIFGPSFTCIFFATSLMQSGNFSLGNWLRKIRQDLPGAWLAGIGFWPLVDLVSYSLISKDWIPLFVNVCSLIWTIYLSIVANRSARTA